MKAPWVHVRLAVEHHLREAQNARAEAVTRMCVADAKIESFRDCLDIIDREAAKEAKAQEVK